jgi:hypothetical protein
MNKKFWIFLIVSAFVFVLFFKLSPIFESVISYSPELTKDNTKVIGKQDTSTIQIQNKQIAPVVSPLDIALYDKKLNELANNPPVIPPKPATKIVKDPKTGKKTTITIPAKKVIAKPFLWPVKTAYPNAGAILPFSRIIAYYGNLYSTKMGVLGEYPEAEMFQKLETEAKKWESADPNTPVVKALHYIAVVAQGKPGQDGKYRARMPSTEIDKVLAMAAKINAIVFLDLQVGFSNVQTEIPLLEKYLKMPNVHLAIDPEFSMKSGIRPGKIVGTMDASDVNFASDYLAKIVQENNLTPKILIVHRYTEKMVTNYKQIKTMPEVQIVMNMDGWGEQAKKMGTYQHFIYPEPVQFAGFKLFYKNDLWGKDKSMLSPVALLELNPRPIYIQYQ